MGKYNENIRDNSIWNTKTASPFSDSLPVSVIEAGHFYANVDYEVKRDYHNSFLLLYSVAGKGFVHCAGQDFSLMEKEALLIDCRAPHSYQSAGGPWDFLWLHFQGTLSETLFSYLYPEGPRVIRVVDQASFSLSFNRIIDEIVLFDADHCFSVSVELQNMIGLLSKDRSRDEALGKRMDSLSARAMEYMEENLAEPLTVADLAGHFHLSEYHFIRTFKKATGLSPYSYLTDLRITRSKRLLVETDSSIEEISRLSGFADPANYIEKFKRLTGETPLKYRKAFRL